MAVRGDDDHPSTPAAPATSRWRCPRRRAPRIARSRPCGAMTGTVASPPAGGTRSWPVSRGGCARSRRARPGLHRLLHLRPAPDRGLLRGQQAGEGLPRHQQCRLELAAVHVLGRRRLHGDVRLRMARRRPTPISTKPTASCCSGPTPRPAIPIVWARIRDAAGPRRPVIVVDPRRHRHRCRRRPPPARCAPATDLVPRSTRCSPRSTATGLVDHKYLEDHVDGYRGGRSRAARRVAAERAARPPAACAADDIVRAAAACSHAAARRWRCGRWAPTSRRVGTAQEPCAHQPLPGDRAHRTAGPGPFSLTGQPNAMGGREIGRARPAAARLPARSPPRQTARR